MPCGAHLFYFLSGMEDVSYNVVAEVKEFRSKYQALRVGIAWGIRTWASKAASIRVAGVPTLLEPFASALFFPDKWGGTAK